jgi:hypothetical protein
MKHVPISALKVGDPFLDEYGTEWIFDRIDMACNHLRCYCAYRKSAGDYVFTKQFEGTELVAPRRKRGRDGH